MKKFKETENGIYEWIGTNEHNSDEGFWSQIEDKAISSHRMPFACPGCGGMFYNKDDQYYYRWGVCSDCYVDFLEGRDNLGLKSNEERAAYCKTKILERARAKP